ncbi:hypothetical protein OG594_26335 [Streptomyces sp. NBC_01214]|uniref:hypothetical protein n=1 Tax=Streptomyces sp. NBC_01214 TaxID=2903777 RepID=UPI00224D8061|nr:hypothetical protein [Streptomyces sp. NBC_01214]MCX4805084.1 hypothetical protein [Streptomyces sp. NBC_01214]
MSPELITAIATLAGVALGIAGTLSAARIQAKGSHAQADATYRAARTTATAQYAATLEQQNRAAQRAAYVGLLAVTREFVRRAEYTRSNEGDRDHLAHDLREPLVQVETAFAAVELEGPEGVLAAAREIADASFSFKQLLDLHGHVYRAINKLWARHFHSSLSDFPAIESLDRLRSIHRDLSPRDRVHLISSRDMPARAGEMGEPGIRWRTEFLRARSLLQVYVEEGIITEVERESILRHTGTWDHSVADMLDSAQEKLDAVLVSFIQAARMHLNATAPRHD